MAGDPQASRAQEPPPRGRRWSKLTGRVRAGYQRHLALPWGRRWRRYGLVAAGILLVTAPTLPFPVLRRFLTTEDSLLESGTVLVLLALLVLLLARVRRCRARGLPFLPTAVAALATGLFVGEELSWAIRWFGFRWYIRDLRVDQVHDVVRLALDPGYRLPGAQALLALLVAVGLGVGLLLIWRHGLLRWLLTTPGGWALVGGIALLLGSGVVEHHAEVTGIEKQIPHLLRYPEELLELYGAGCFLIALIETEARGGAAP